MSKTILITGASRGIGKEISERLSEKGYNILANYNKTEIKSKENIEVYKADVSKREEVKEMVKYCLEEFGQIDILINNAGISEIKMFQDITEGDWDKMMNVNLKGTFNVTQEVLPNMIKNKNGCIINISSIWGITGASCETHYSVSKAGIIGLTKALAKELGPSGIRVNAIAPGAVTTDMNKNVTAEEWKIIKEETPLQKIGRPVDVVRCIEWLIEDEFTTGQVISPNGGLVI